MSLLSENLQEGTTQTTPPAAAGAAATESAPAAAAGTSESSTTVTVKADTGPAKPTPAVTYIYSKIKASFTIENIRLELFNGENKLVSTSTC